jgi:hypothetical protein
LIATVAMAAAASAQQTARYIGTDGDWFNARNWSTGRVPDATTDVVIGDRSRVTIAPTRSAVVIRDLLLTGEATLETQPGTRFFSRNELVSGRSRLVHRSTEAGSSDPNGSLIVTTYQGWTLNPSPKQKRIIVLINSVTSNLALGGALAASPSGYGPGYYATATADYVLLAGRLNVGLMHGFQPRPGQSFQIVTANRSMLGQFEDLREGALAVRFGDVGLYITYRGGDGNDVVLHARPVLTTP